MPMKLFCALLTQFFIAFFIWTVQPVQAMDLQTAKEQGLVGETASGYLEAVHRPCHRNLSALLPR